MLPIVGTIRNAVNLAIMDNKWQQKKASGNIFQKEMDPQQRQINQFQEDLMKMRENNELASISNKLRSGDTLTAEEIEYLQKNNPELYREYVEIQQEKKAYEKQLRSCKTKDEVERLKFNKMSSLLAQAKSVSSNANIPEGQKVALMEKFLMKAVGIQKIHMKFVQSSYYQNLPTDAEVAKEAKDKVEQKKEAAEETKESVEENAEAAEKTRENVEENAEVNEKTRENIEENAEVAEKTRENIGENAKVAEKTQEDVEENSVIGDEAAEKLEVSMDYEPSKIELPELKAKADIAFEETKKEVIQYIKEHRPKGFGMEYLDDELKSKKYHS